MTAQFPTAVHALVYLLHKGTLVSSTELADNICTNAARVRKIMAQLHHAGLVNATEGRSSGYTIIPQGALITLTDVAHALEEVPVSVSWRSGDIDRNCQVSSGMAAEMDQVYDTLNVLCFTGMKQITIGTICDHIFQKK